MIRYPKLKSSGRYRQVMDKFRGYNRNLRIGNGEFAEMENLTSDDYPVLSTRKKRGCLRHSLQDGGYATGMLYVADTGLFIAVNQQDPQDQDNPMEIGKLHLLGLDGDIKTVSADLTPGRKSLALMGKFLIVAPDMRWVNTDDLTYGDIFQVTEIADGAIELGLYMADGTPLQKGHQGIDPPTDPQSYSHWVDTSGALPQIMRYSVAQEQWVAVEHTTVMLETDGIRVDQFNVGDTVNITGFIGQAAHFNGLHTITECPRENAIVVDGVISAGIKQSCKDYPIKIERNVPQLDFITECGNRLWGCKADTNEIYACKLGDFHNWNCFQGLSTDSWVGNVGTPGAFTGAAVQNNYPVFYKEACKHKVWPSASGAHQITTVTMPGVQKGCPNSIAVLEGAVFYKAPSGVFMDDGGGAVEIGQSLGNVPYRDASGAIHEGKYYLTMLGADNQDHLFVYDIDRRMWHREKGVSGALASGGGSLYTVDRGEVWDLTGNTGTLEEAVSWMAVTADLGLELPEQKYITRLTLRLSLDPGATLEIYAQYDREQAWVKLGQVYGTDLRSFSLPVRPRRCDQLRLKLQGKGMCKLYSITKTLGKGSEL